MTDRLLGVCGILLALAYGFTGYGFRSEYTDMLGAGAFPMLLAFALALFSALIIIRPPHGACEWPSAHIWARKIVAVVAMVIYGLTLEWLGFVIASFLLIVVLVWLMAGTLRQSAITAVIVSPMLYMIFDPLLGLPLPTGSIFKGILGG